MTHRSRTVLAVLAYGLSLLLPALQLNGEGVPGWYAACMAPIGCLTIMSGAELLNSGAQTACLFGTVANLSLLLAIVASLREAVRGAAQLSALAFGSAAISVIALAVSESSFYPQLGCGVWLGAMAWLGWGSAREAGDP